jgi:DNA invertase Pin-like site-specific DNA recombinase
MLALLGNHILGLTLAEAQNLKRKIDTPTMVPSLLLLMSDGGTQSKFTHFSKSETESATQPELQDSDPENEPTESDPPDSEELEESIDAQTGLIYARVSSEKQRDGDANTDGPDEGSIQGQIEEMEEIADKCGIKLPYDPITDEAKTGTNFERDGIQQVFEMSKRKDIDNLLVEKVDRVGRNAAETLYFIYVLQSECGVTLVTNSGERDISKTHGLMHTTLMSLMAEVQNDLRVAKANKERIRGFLKKKNWKCKQPDPPLGYDETENGWLTINADQKRVVRDLFRKFVECETYAETERYIDEAYDTDYLDGHKVKTILQYRVYIGKPQLPEDWLVDTTYENDLEDPDLHLLRREDQSEIDVSEETFHEAQEIIERKDEKYDYDGGLDLMDFIEEFSLFSVIKGTDPAQLLHHCGEPMVKDGQVTVNGYHTHRYKCPECEETEDAEDYYRRWPKGFEIDKMTLIEKVIADKTSLFGDDQ